MGNLIRAELFKLRKDRAFRMLLIAVVFIAAAFPMLVYYDNASDGDPQSTGLEFFFESLGINVFIIKFGIAILAGFFISAEYSTGVMKTIASSGSARIRLFLAKLVGFSVGAMILSVLLPLICMAVAGVLGGFGQLPPEAPAEYVIRTVGFTLLYAVGFASISALFSTLLTDSGKSIGFSFLFFMLIDTILNMLGGHIPFFRTVYQYSVFNMLGKISDYRFGEGELASLLLVPLLTIAGFALLGILAYRRKEIK